VVCAAALAAAAACDKGEARPAPPPFAGQALEVVARDSVLAYARRLPYVFVAGDSQRLMLGSCPADCRYGPLARIDPVAGGFRLDSASLGRGWLLARVINADTVPYPKLNLGPRDTVYWWVDGSRGRLRSLLVSSQPGAELAVRGFRVHPHPELDRRFRWRQAQARFLWSETDEALWVACDWAQCCRLDESFGFAFSGGNP
jgi:hypothetical protein